MGSGAEMFHQGRTLLSSKGKLVMRGPARRTAWLLKLKSCHVSFWWEALIRLNKSVLTTPKPIYISPRKVHSRAWWNFLHASHLAYIKFASTAEHPVLFQLAWLMQKESRKILKFLQWNTKQLPRACQIRKMTQKDRFKPPLLTCCSPDPHWAFQVRNSQTCCVKFHMDFKHVTGFQLE